MSAWLSGTMRAFEFSGPNELTWVEAEIPAAGPSYALVRVEALGICGTDVHLFTGSSSYLRLGLTEYPFRPGHEFCGEVVAVGDDVRGIGIGDRVVGQPFLPCKICRVCMSGRMNLCPNRGEQGVRGTEPGAAAQYVRVPAENLAVVPRSLVPAEALLAESSVTALSSVVKGGVEPGKRVAVIGSGTIGLLATQLAAGMGAVVDTIGIDDGLRLAVECGASSVFHPDEAPFDAYDVVIEAAGAPGSLGLALRLAGPGGTITQTSIPGSASTDVQASLMVAKGLTIVSVLGGIEHLQSAVDLIARGVIVPRRLIDSVREWSGAEQAFADLMAGGLARPKIVLSVGV
ncbi:alcohol dehydrogenase catalytic domain-containing protein [Leucobacter weissii]|uniref:Alcohol dehydrogenase catalytic domain-containing protein n=1 Tax=Leucobacter weissii TaxID=1983706 RepID=A0A939SA30_9MICO|nr:alcohol dehydrogenase catalytic domain-containing protein [Leucobacter weissii]MBO1901527.1 alcohol dehydrogenase catalytic domain-containing protein [Leucobacter weissii]